MPDSEETTDTSVSDDGRMVMPLGGHSRSRPASIRTTASMATMQTSSARNYFTHTGRVAVDPDAPKVPKLETAKAATAVDVKKQVEKKKSRMSLSFGRKSKVAA